MASKDSTPRTAWTKNSWYIIVFLMDATEARASSRVDLSLLRSPGHRPCWGGSQGGAYLLTHYSQAQSVRGVLPFCSWLLPREVKRFFLCVPSLLAGIHKMTGITWEPEWFKQTHNPQLKQPLQNNKENLTLWFFEQELTMQVHQSFWVTTKALGWFLSHSSCWSKTNRTQPTITMFIGNHEITKRTGEVYTVRALSTAAIELYDLQGNLKRHISAFWKEHGEHSFQRLEHLLPKRTRWCGRRQSKIKA